MKEFVQESGIEFDSINISDDDEGAAKLTAIGGLVPAAVVGNQWVSGVDLEAVARLLRIEYQERCILAPSDLHDRYTAIMSVLCDLLRQTTPATMRARRPDRDRTLADIAYHAASIMRSFLYTYDPDCYYGELYDIRAQAADGVPGGSTADSIIESAGNTLAMFNEWWDNDGYDDPLDRILETYWGHQTLHAQLEREVWHSAQHVRQVSELLNDAGVVPNKRLGQEELAGLPMPQRVFV
jgi:hypothetical protein